MAGYIEVLSSPARRVSLEAARYVIGSDPLCDIALPEDRTVSRLHAVVEALGARWLIKDLGSRNGTVLNGERLGGERVLHSGDEVRVGRTSVLFHEPQDTIRSETEATSAAPLLTARERDVLLVLCTPLLRGTPFTPPASVRQIAQKLFVSETAIRHHLLRLYAKFGIVGGDDLRRILLANEAINVGAVSVAHLRAAAEHR